MSSASVFGSVNVMLANSVGIKIQMSDELELEKNQLMAAYGERITTIVPGTAYTASHRILESSL